MSGTERVRGRMDLGVIFIRLDSDHLAITPNHGVLSEATLPFERFSNGVAERIESALIVGRQRSHRVASFTN